MIFNSEHKLCRAFGRLFKTRNTFKTNVHCTRLGLQINNACLPHRPCPGSNSGPPAPEASALPLNPLTRGRFIMLRLTAGHQEIAA